MHHGPEGITEDILNREMDFCFSSLDKLKQNESAWNYLRGLEQYHPALKQPISRKCEEIVTTSDMPNVFALSFLSDLRLGSVIASLGFIYQIFSCIGSRI